MRRDRFVGLHQFFQQGVAKHHPSHVLPEGAQSHKQALPVSRLQGMPQHVRGLQQRHVFIEQGQGVSERSARGMHTRALYLFALQLIEPQLGLRKTVPTASVEEIMQVVARRHTVLRVDEIFVSLSLRQCGLRHKFNRRPRWQSIQGSSHTAMKLPVRPCGFSPRPPWGEPRRGPIQDSHCLSGLRCQASICHGSASPARKGLSSASPKAKASGGVQLWRCSVTWPWLRGRS